jgi:hypothetical protein
MTGGPWTLHQLRHSALTHAAEESASTSTLLAYSGHTSVRSLARYARVSAEVLGSWPAQRGPAERPQLVVSDSVIGTDFARTDLWEAVRLAYLLLRVSLLAESVGPGCC